MNSRDWPRLALTAFIMALLGLAALRHYSPGIEETIKAITLIAVGYWLGSSKGSADKTNLLENGTRQVEINQPPGEPVPVTTAPDDPERRAPGRKDRTDV